MEPLLNLDGRTRLTARTGVETNVTKHRERKGTKRRPARLGSARLDHGREKSQAFLSSNLRADDRNHFPFARCNFSPLSSSTPLAALLLSRFTVLLIRQQQLASEDTLYINFGYRLGRCLPASGSSVALRFSRSDRFLGQGVQWTTAG